MILTTSAGDYPIPPEVAQKLPTVPPLPDQGASDYRQQVRDFEHWLDAEPSHTIDFERLRRWHTVQEERAVSARTEGRPFVVTDDGLE
ncbi:hypothetical protein [Brevundimonas variabilis]|uniref:Uncharacterized protein n=1 Tax=Brevundimonas variabilis TaxID=74312 RepID=A0A7W9CGN2_9CAUL|nr:hypothetical protein [Brevundimonas variabilis]MBB5745295.1 hypothetical protein [Brevundimonas variabilis]